MKKIILTQFFVLLIGTVFAWSNFTLELFNWLNNKACTTGCSISGAGNVANPFLTPCFYGAVFFVLAFALSLAMVLINKTKIKAEEKKVETDIK
ncbi:MAG: hypothetical protein BWY51_00909 [Parcubacteria group bacterium ADurb.Bin316]|nr:MAG: hypothetical protein BWY51_00909 [Parcubacteria group bacterium ADurb.Bin316]HOZ56045.1 hypothetical protein [bacterium]